MTDILEEMQEQHYLSFRRIKEIEELRETVQLLVKQMEHIKNCCSDENGNPVGLFGKLAYTAAVSALNNPQLERWTTRPATQEKAQ